MTHTAHQANPPGRSATSVEAWVDGWLAQGIITEEQARLMLAGRPVEQEAGRHGARTASIALEVAGYLGGALVVVATLLVGARYWDELTTAVRLVTIGAAVAGLLIAGLLVSGLGPVGTRLTSVLFLASTASFSGLVAVAVDTAPSWHDHASVVIAASTASYAVLLWLWHRTLVQQVVVAASGMVTAGVLIGDLTDADALPGLGVWGVAAAWMVLGLRGRPAPSRFVPALAGAAMVLGVILTLPTPWGFALAFVTIALLVRLAALRRDLLLLAVAALGMLQVLPAAAVEWFPDSVVAPFVLLAVGVLMVAAAVWVALRRSPSSPPRRAPQRDRNEPEEHS